MGAKPTPLCDNVQKGCARTRIQQINMRASTSWGRGQDSLAALSHPTPSDPLATGQCGRPCRWGFKLREARHDGLVLLR